jgi:hypothetical protein
MDSTRIPSTHPLSGRTIKSVMPTVYLGGLDSFETWRGMWDTAYTRDQYLEALDAGMEMAGGYPDTYAKVMAFYLDLSVYSDSEGDFFESRSWQEIVSQRAVSLLCECLLRIRPDDVFVGNHLTDLVDADRMLLDCIMDNFLHPSHQLDPDDEAEARVVEYLTSLCGLAFGLIPSGIDPEKVSLAGAYIKPVIEAFQHEDRRPKAVRLLCEMGASDLLIEAKYAGLIKYSDMGVMSRWILGQGYSTLVEPLSLDERTTHSRVAEHYVVLMTMIETLLEDGVLSKK